MLHRQWGYIVVPEECKSQSGPVFVIVFGDVFLFVFVIFFVFVILKKGNLVLWLHGVDVDIVGPLKNVTAVPCKKGSQYWPSSYNSCPPAPVHPQNVYDNF